MSKILVIEDDYIVRKQIIEMLEYEGFSVEEAENGKIGIDQAKRVAPDLIVCDIMMPELDGFDVLQAVRADINMRETPFIFLTARVQRRDVRRGMAEGADDYLTKPFEADQLLDSIRSRLRRRAQQIEDSKRLVEEVSLAAARVVPGAISAVLNNMRSVIGIMFHTADEDVERAIEMCQALSSHVNELDRMIQRLNLYAQIPALYARRFEIQDEATVDARFEKANSSAMRIAAMYQRTADMEIGGSEGEWPMQEVYYNLIIEELVENACRFSGVGTSIQLELSCEAGFYRLTVRDRGCGMDSEEIARIGAFKQFWTAQSPPRGLGIGLALVQAVTRFYGGEFNMESEKGEGTTVTILMPKE